MTDSSRRNLPARPGGRILVDSLVAQGVEMAFGVPGESYLAVLDALHDSPIRFVACRQEGGAAMMADAYGKLTGRPGICMVTRGPGATNAAAGVHVAYQDSTPMVLLIGQVGRGMADREAFQEIDFRRMFGEMAKWIGQIDEPRRIPEYVSHAFHTAMNGRPGPVVLALPEDMLREQAEAVDVDRAERADAWPGPDALDRTVDLLGRAERPIAVVGGGGWSAAAATDMQAVATAWDLPVGVSFRCQDYVDNDHPSYAGHVGIGINPALADRVRRADLVLAIGPRLGEMTTSGYTLLTPPVTHQALVHVHAGAEELGRVYRPTLAVNAAPAAFVRALAQRRPQTAATDGDRCTAAHAEHAAHARPVTTGGPLQMAEIVAGLRARLPDETIVCNGAGNYAVWIHRFWSYRRYRTQLAPTSGSMGYGVPAAVAAALVHPDRPVLSVSGDGCFMMHGQELATAVHHRLNILFLVVNNGMYGTIRMHQEREYPGRVSGTGLTNPDFAALARAYGAHGEAVSTTEAFEAAFDRCRAAEGPALIELRLDPEIITPQASLSEIRAAAQARSRD